MLDTNCNRLKFSTSLRRIGRQCGFGRVVLVIKLANTSRCVCSRLALMWRVAATLASLLDRVPERSTSPTSRIRQK
jgi:hypothetical protein